MLHIIRLYDGIIAQLIALVLYANDYAQGEDVPNFLKIQQPNLIEKFNSQLIKRYLQKM